MSIKSFIVKISGRRWSGFGGMCTKFDSISPSKSKKIQLISIDITAMKVQN